MSGGAEAERHRRRQKVQRRFAAIAFLLVLLGLIIQHGLQYEWGQLVFLAGVLTNLAGYGAAPLLYPKPLREG